MLFPTYVWIAYSRNYFAALRGAHGGCGDIELAEFLDGVFTITAAAAESSMAAAVKEVGKIM